MLDEKGFDRWADGYDASTGRSDGEGSYPFAGYQKVLAEIARRALEKPGRRVLDIGFGTGVLTAALYEQGCEVYGQDFSARMVELARRKMPAARLVQGDFSRGLAEELRVRRYDAIVATYSLHHLTDEEKTRFLASLLPLLTREGSICIGDVAFATRAELEACRRRAAGRWDPDEIYFVADELQTKFPALTFTPLSHCAGVLELPAEQAR